jgi:hypothetical protein
MMDDRTLLAVAIEDEAGNQPHEGKVAVGRVIMNRLHAKFFSDGTMAGTVLHYIQFSGFWCDFVGGKYQVVAHTPADAMARAQDKLARYSAGPGWTDALLAADQSRGVQAFAGGPQFQKLTDKTVLYLNPKVVHPLPAWASSANEDAVIFDHTFFHA